MRLHYIYIAIGIFTLLLNGILTFGILRKTAGNTKNEVSYDCGGDTITFYLGEKRKYCAETTATALSDDTVLLERQER